MVRCQSCNSILPDGATACGACGRQLPAASPTTPPPSDAPNNLPSVPPATVGAAAAHRAFPSPDPTVTGGAPPQPVVVGPQPLPRAAKSGNGLKIAGLVMGGLVLFALVVLVVVVAIDRGRSPNVATAGSTNATSSPAASTSVATVHSSGDASVKVTAQDANVIVGEAITIVVDFVGNPAEVDSSALVLGGVPTDQSSKGLRNQFTIPSQLPGSVEAKVVILLKDGRTIESNPATVTVVTTTTTTARPVVSNCEDIGFQHGTDDVAADIVATGLSCNEAMALVRRVRDLESAGPLTTDGFSCSATFPEVQGLGYGLWTCTSGARKVTWKKF